MPWCLLLSSLQTPAYTLPTWSGHLSFSFGLNYVDRHRSNHWQSPGTGQNTAHPFRENLFFFCKSAHYHNPNLADVNTSMFVPIYLLALLVKLPSLHPCRGLTFPFIGCQQQILTFGALLSRVVWNINTYRPWLCWSEDTSQHSFQTVSKQRLQRWLLKLCS